MILLAVYSVAHIVVVNNMRRRTPGAMRAATVLCAIMMLGFPLLTIVGVLCIQKIRLFYPI